MSYYSISEVQKRKHGRPTELRKDGSFVFKERGQLNRTDGPAYIHNGTQLMWYRNGNKYSDEVNKWIADHDIQLNPEKFYSFRNKEDQLYFTMMTA